MSGIDAPGAGDYACACGNTCACRNTTRYTAPTPPNGTRSTCYICGCEPGEPHGPALSRGASDHAPEHWGGDTWGYGFGAR